MVCLFLLPTKTISNITYIHYCPTWILLLALCVVIPCILWGNDWECCFFLPTKTTIATYIHCLLHHPIPTTQHAWKKTQAMWWPRTSFFFICLFVCLFGLFTYQCNIHIAYCIILFLESSSCLCVVTACVLWGDDQKWVVYLFVCFHLPTHCPHCLLHHSLILFCFVASCEVWQIGSAFMFRYLSKELQHSLWPTLFIWLLSNRQLCIIDYTLQ